MPHRLFLGAVIFGLFTLTVSAASPQDKKDKAQEAKLLRELREARADLAQAKQQAADLRQKNAQLQAQLKKERNENDDKTIKALRQEVAELKQKNAQLEEQAKKAKAGGQAAKEAQVQPDAVRKAGYVHCVVFRLKPDTPPSEVQSLLDDVPAVLGNIKSVRGIWAGPPAKEATPEVAVKDYEVGLLVLFENADGLKKYLDDPLHAQFVEKHAKLWQPPQVYDFQRK